MECTAICVTAPARRHDQQKPEDQNAVVGDEEDRCEACANALMARNAASASRSSRRWSDSGCSCWVQWPHARISTFSRSGTRSSMPSAILGDSTTSSSAMIISEGTFTLYSSSADCSQLRVKLRYQLMPPVKPVRVKVSTKIFSSSGVQQHLAAPAAFVGLQRADQLAGCAPPAAAWRIPPGSRCSCA